MSQSEIQKLEKEAYELHQKLAKLRKDIPPIEVKNYSFKTIEGEVSLLDLFGDKDTLFLIHNMGQGCRYCTLWADGFNPFLRHLEDCFAVALASKDDPTMQRRFANERGWRFRMVSHGGGEYIKEQDVCPSTSTGDQRNHPGIVVYERKGEKIYRKNKSVFGPGDEFCALWPLLSLAGHNAETWTPQFSYWNRPQKMDDGGQNIQ